MRKSMRAGAGLGVLLEIAAASTAHAEVTFNGFGQIVGGTTLSNTHPATQDATQPLYTGADPQFEPETLFALQASSPLGKDFSATTQILARGKYDFEPRFDWAYVTYSGIQHWKIKAGRQRTPQYRYSDYLDVGLAYPWMRPPIPVYLTIISNVNGVSAAGNYDVGGWTLQPTLLYGTTKENAQADITVDASRYALAAFEATYDDWLSLRASYTINTISVNRPALNQALNALRAIGQPAAADELDIHNDTGTFAGVGVSINRSNWMIDAEYTAQSTNHSLAGRSKNYYISVGHRLGRWVPVASWGRTMRGHNDDASKALVPTTADCGFGAGSCAFVAASIVNQVVTPSRYNRQYFSSGVRYDIRDNIALKFDYTAIEAGNAITPSANLFTAGVSFTF